MNNPASSEPIRDFTAALDASLGDGSFVRITLGHYRGTDETLKTIQVKRVLIKREEKLSFTYRHKTRDIVKNYAVAEGRALIAAAFGSEFLAATLFTTGFDLVYDAQNKKSPLRRGPASQTSTPSLGHDRDKKRLIGADGKAWLHALGITDASGKVLNAAQDKYRQINQYIEILRPLIEAMPAGRTAKIVDMGSGKGYLTFALYDYLTTTLNLQPQVTGVEYRADLVELCNRIAAESGMKGLHFVQGSIADYAAAGTDILIALHACDTATDDAIYQGISAGAELIVVAPCCHKQIRREMEKNSAQPALDFLLRHGIFMEREAEMVTDGMRALLLDYSGYHTRVFEFIGGEHTPKNILIVAAKNARDDAGKAAALEKFRTAKAHFGVGYHHLERKLGL